MSLRAVAGLLAAMALGASAAEAAKSPWRDGDVVRIVGQVTDFTGRPLGGVTVLLEASRDAYSLRRFTREIKDTVTTPVKADAEGRFTVDWHWDRYYNTFWLAVALPVKKGGVETFDVFDRVDVTQNVDRGGPETPVEVRVSIPEGPALTWLLRVVTRQASDDELRVYREQGRPDRIDEEKDGAATRFGWWYFQSGRLYRFRAGRLEQVVPFEPVQPF